MNRQFLKFYLNTFDYLINLLDIKESNFRNHAHIIARYAELIGKELGLSDGEMSETMLAAYFHDFGRLLTGIKESTEDRELIEEFVEKINPPFDIMNILKNIKEHYDGSGPQGLQKDQIPIASRIIPLINYFEYHIKQNEEELEVIKKERALRKIATKSGSIFDPLVVEAFIRVLKKEHTDIYERMSFLKTRTHIVLAAHNNYSASVIKLRLVKEGFGIIKVEDPLSFSETESGSGYDLIIADREFADTLPVSFNNGIPFILYESKEKNTSSIHTQNALHVHTYPISIDALTRNVTEFINTFSKKSEGFKETAGFFERAGSFYKAAEIYRELGDHRSAAHMYEKAHDFNMAAHMYLTIDDIDQCAQAYERAKKYELASKYYGQVGNILKQNEMYEKLGKYYALGKNYFRSHKLDEAIIVLQKVETSSGDFKKASHLLGKIFMAQKRFGAAIISLDKAISGEEINKRNCKSFYLLGRSYEVDNRLDKALIIYEKILGEQFDYLDVLGRIDSIKKRIEEQKEAEEKAKEAARFIIPSKIESEKKPRYKKIKEIGRGGMGTVYEALDTVLDRTVALKVLAANLQKDQKVVETFIREAKSAARLNHINIVTVYDAGIQEGSYYIAMELIDGSTIREILKNRRLSIGSVIGLLKQITRGLEYAHKNSIIHRDLTTNNIMLTANKIVKIMDFGLARVIKHLMSEQSIIGGTPSFMSPEQVEGDPIDHRSDIYTLGVSIFEMSTGEVPFQKGDLGYHHLHTSPREPKLINPKIPDFLNTMILKCLEKNPNNRFQSVGEIIGLLNQMAK